MRLATDEQHTSSFPLSFDKPMASIDMLAQPKQRLRMELSRIFARKAVRADEAETDTL